MAFPRQQLPRRLQARSSQTVGFLLLLSLVNSVTAAFGHSRGNGEQNSSASYWSDPRAFQSTRKEGAEGEQREAPSAGDNRGGGVLRYSEVSNYGKPYTVKVDGRFLRVGGRKTFILAAGKGRVTLSRILCTMHTQDVVVPVCAQLARATGLCRRGTKLAGVLSACSEEDSSAEIQDLSHPAFGIVWPRLNISLGLYPKLLRFVVHTLYRYTSEVTCQPSSARSIS